MTVEELVLKMLHEVEKGGEISSTGLIIHSLHTLEDAFEKALIDLQSRGILKKRWRPETNMLVFAFNEPKTSDIVQKESIDSIEDIIEHVITGKG